MSLTQPNILRTENLGYDFSITNQEKSCQVCATSARYKGKCNETEKHVNITTKSQTPSKIKTEDFPKIWLIVKMLPMRHENHMLKN